MRELTIDLTEHVYIDFEGFLRNKSGKQLLRITPTDQEYSVAEQIVKNQLKAVRARVVIDVETEEELEQSGQSRPVGKDRGIE